MNCNRKCLFICFSIILLTAFLFFVVMFDMDIDYKYNSEKAHVQPNNLKLPGEWDFYWLSLIKPEEFADGTVRSTPTSISMPTDLSKKFSADGYGTLYRQVKVSQLNNIVALKNNYLSSSYKIWVNGELLDEAGEVASKKANFTPAYSPMQVVFKSEETVDVVIHISNFHHRRVRLGTFYLGPVEEIEAVTDKGIVKDSILFGSLFLIGVYHFILYFIRRKERVFLYFSLISIIVGLRVGIVNERLLVRLFDGFPAEIMMKIGYLPDFILLPLFILYIKEIFRSKELDWPVKFATYSIPVFVIMIAVTTVKFYDWLFQYGLWIFLVTGLYVMYVLLRELKQKVVGSYVMVLGGLCVLATAINDTLRELDVIQTEELLTTGVLLFVLSQAFYLAWRYNDAFNRAVFLAQENEAMYEEIRELNEDLEEKIQDRTQELMNANEKLAELVKIDPLTELPNRRYFNECLQIEWVRALQSGLSLSLLMVDIDYFKGYNDCYGHLQGDECLKTVATQLQQNVRKDMDVVARYGGEEFVVLLPNTNLIQAKGIAETLRQAIEQLQVRHERSDVAGVVTISVGVNSAVITNHHTIEQFISQADEALYIGKEHARNCVQCYE